MADMNDRALLLQITAAMHRAGTDPARWSLALAQLGDYMACPQVYGGFLQPDRDAENLPDRLAALLATAAACAGEALPRLPPGTAGDDSRCRICPEILEHLDLARPGGRRLPATGQRERHDDLLEAPHRPLFVCDQEGSLVHVNHGGREELARTRWLRLEADRLHCRLDGDRVVFQRLVLRERVNRGGKWHLALPMVDGCRAELWGRRLLRRDDSSQLFLLSLLVLGSSADEPAAGECDPGDALCIDGLSPRQLQLAGLLLAGRNLAAAAEEMGISRRTANDHLGALFRHSGTRRQADLVAWLSRAAS